MAILLGRREGDSFQKASLEGQAGRYKLVGVGC